MLTDVAYIWSALLAVMYGLSAYLHYQIGQAPEPYMLMMVAYLGLALAHQRPLNGDK